MMPSNHSCVKYVTRNYNWPWKGKMPTAGLERLGSLARELADDPGLTGVESAKKRIYLASDASLDGYGVVDLDTGNQVRGVWKHVHVTGDMYYLEALAAKRAVMYAPANTEIILITDNMGLVWSRPAGFVPLPP